MISILMATFNGERYIAEQMESLFTQTIQDFVLYVQDDCSTDNTYNILCQFAQRYKNRIFVSKTPQNTESAKNNFIKMMVAHKQDYVMLCDQDDVWKPNKIELTLEKIQKMEKKYGVSEPILVHTDLEIVDKELNTISPSLQKAMKVNYNRTALNYTVIQNILAGCTAMYNRALADLICTVPHYLVMHDWWLILVASAFGKVDYVNDPTIYYRQHGQNSIGAKDIRKLSYKWNMVIHADNMKKAIAETYLQAESFCSVYQDRLTEMQKSFLNDYCRIPSYGKIKRIGSIIRLGCLKNGFSRRIAQILYS